MTGSARAGAIDPERAAETVLEGLRGLPGGLQLLQAVGARADAELVGGATRDLLLGRTPLELDVVVADGAEALARELAAMVDGQGQRDADVPGARAGGHERFATAFVTWPGGRIDIATRRAESYSAPGALPAVGPGSAEQDLLRRDFTVNAIAVGLGAAPAPRLRAPAHATEDLRAGQLRVLHEQSFLDDPTRLLRLARYRARLGFEPEAHTAALAKQALGTGALQTVSAARIGAELRLALREPDAAAALSSLQQLGILAALVPPLGFPEALAREALALLPDDGRGDLLLLACTLLSLTSNVTADHERQARDMLDAMEFAAQERERALRSALEGQQLSVALGAARSGAQVREAVRGAPLEAVALAGALGARDGREQATLGANRWLSELRHVRLRVTGDDLLAAGIPQGPEVGLCLDRLLDMRLEGQVGDSREAQLQAALRERP
jgi:tRNA nucleotidyltransferase (CCA-adding enzyme)